MPLARTLGPLSIVALDDGCGTFFQPRAEAFPAATAELWHAADAADPGAVTADGEWLLRFRCFAIRPAHEPGPVILVDAGIGPADSPAAAWAPVPGRLPEELDAAGIDPAEVTAVVLSHLHTDHIGWAVVGTEAHFPNARYVLQRADAEAVTRFNPGLPARLLDPLRASGQLSLVEGSVTLAEGVRVVPTPGHTPGHQSVLVETAAGTMLIAGDLLVHMAQLIDPELAYAHELDQPAARASRTALLSDLSARGNAVLASAHLTEPFTPISRQPRQTHPAPPAPPSTKLIMEL